MGTSQLWLHHDRLRRIDRNVDYNTTPYDAKLTCLWLTHSQETCTSRLVQETWPSDMLSCTRFFVYKFLAPNTAQLYSIQETCMHVTRIVSSDWSAAYRCHVFILLCWCCWQCYSSKNSVFPWSGRRKVLRKLFVKNAHFHLTCRQPNLHELARKFDARNLCKFLVQVSWLCVTTIILLSCMPQPITKQEVELWWWCIIVYMAMVRYS